MGQIVSIKALKQALTNQVFLLEYDNDQHYIFKRLNLKARDPQDRKRELLVQQLACVNGLSPKVIAYCELYILQEYIKGDSLASACIDSEHIEKLASQLHIIHQLPALYAGPQRLVLELQIVKKKIVKKQLSSPLDEVKFNHFLQCAAQLDKRCARDLLCHGDLSLNNLIVTEDKQIKILDWEYAVLACAAYDLACCVCINALSWDQEEALINHYYLLHKEELSLSLEQLKNECALYRSLLTYLNQLWSLAFVSGS